MTTPNATIPQSPEVTTEPQCQELARMSHELERKLQTMIVEQQERVRSFTAQQHSLSATPSMPDLPKVPTLDSDQQPAPEPIQTDSSRPAAMEPAVSDEEWDARFQEQTQSPIPAVHPKKPKLPTTRKVVASSAPPLPFDLPERKRKPLPVSDKESPLASLPTWMIGIAVFILFLLLRACS